MGVDSTDWKSLLSIDPDDIDDEAVDKIYSALHSFTPDHDDADQTVHAFKLVQAVMKWKHEEVEEVMEQLEGLDNIREEKEELQRELTRFKEGKGEEGRLEELLEVERELNQANKTIQQQERLLEEARAEKEQSEELSEKNHKLLEKLQRQNEQLEQQLSQTKQAALQSVSESSFEEEVDPRRVRELEDTLRLKNKQIHQLLEDIELLEKETSDLQGKLEQTRDKLEDGTRQIEGQTREYIKMRNSLEDSRNLIESLQGDNVNLKSQLEHQLRDKAIRDNQIQQISVEVDRKVDEMREICETKDAEITELRSRLNRAILNKDTRAPTQHDRENMSLLTKALRERDNQIENLQQKLTQASQQLEDTAKYVEELKGSMGSKGTESINKNLMDTKADLFQAKERIKDLEEQVAEAEEAAKEKSEELSEVIHSLRKYEKGEYGLQEAVNEVQNLRKQVNLKDKRIEELTQQANTLEFEAGELDEENNVLREKLGMEKREGRRCSSARLETPSSSSVNMGRQTEKALMQVLQRELERLEEERIQLKTDNRKLAQQLGERAAKLGLDASDMEAIQEYTQALKNRRSGMTGLDGGDPDYIIKLHEGSMVMQKDIEEKQREVDDLKNQLNKQRTSYAELYDENDKLRLGMHEILESIKKQDGSSDVLVTSPILEHLITVLDARHLYGEYKPVMGLKAQMEKLEGVNSQLREELRRSRLDEDKASMLGQRLKSKVQQLETELDAIKKGRNILVNQPQESFAAPQVQFQPVQQVAAQIAPGAADSVAKLSSQLIHALDELDNKTKACKVMKSDLEKFHQESETQKHQLGILYEEYFDQKSKWDEERNDFKAKLEKVEEVRDAYSAKILEYESHLDVLGQGEDAVEQRVADTARKIAMLKSNEAVLTRRYKATEAQEKLLRNENSRLKEEVTELENHSIKIIGELNRTKELNMFKIKSLQSSLEESVPLSSLEAANRQYNEITAKYRDLLQKQQSHSTQSRTIEELELQVQSNKQEKETYKKELLTAREKMLSLETLMNSLGVNRGNGEAGAENRIEIDRLTKQIATLEIKELNERQKSDHLHNQQKLLQLQNKQLEERNTDLEQKFDIITKSNFELQRVERELRDELVTSIPRVQFDQANQKLKQLLESEISLKLENEKLKEVAEVAQNQVSDLERRREVQMHELEALRHQVLDLQTLTDEKALIGRLHQQIVSLQNKDLSSIQKIKSLQKDISKTESTALKLENKSQNAEQMVIKVRTQYHIKLRSLQKVIQDLRRQYSGSIPLVKQEKLSRSLMEINMEKQKLSTLLYQTENRLKTLEKEKEEMEIKKRGVDEILKTLKHGAGTKQILDWHKKLEDLRLKELHARRNGDEWEKEVLHLRESVKEFKSKNEQLEDELVRLESQMEQRQLEWESHEVEMETIDIQSSMDIKENLLGESQTMLNTDVPLSQQLESALAKVKSLTQEVEKTKRKLQDSRTGYEELCKKNRELESQKLAKDKMINDLRLEIPASVDRAITISSVIGQPGVQTACLPAQDNSKALSVAQGTIDSLRERLKIKEETIEKYEDLLKQSNIEHDETLKLKQQEIADLNVQVRERQTAYNELRSSRMMEDLTSSDTVHQFVTRTQELEDEVQELQESLGKFTADLTNASAEKDKLQRTLDMRNDEIESLKDGKDQENTARQNDMQREIDRLTSEIQTYQQENLILQEDMQVLKDSQSKAPSVVMKSLVDRLRNELAEKEKKQKAMSRVITELKNEMITAAEENVKYVEASKPGYIQNLVDKETKSYQSKIDEQIQLIDKLKRQVKILKESESKLLAEVTKLKEQVEKKSSLIVKLREEKVSGSRGHSRASHRHEHDEEKEELKSKVQALQEKLRIMNQAEKPLEDDKESKIVRNAEEVARWDERKKWQKKVDELKKRLKEADEEVSKISKQNDSLRETVTRIDREKLQLEIKWKNHMKLGTVKTSVADSKIQGLQLENSQLREKLEVMEHRTTMNQDPGVETLKLRVKFLQDRVEKQENKISLLEIAKKGGRDALMKEIDNVRKRENSLQRKTAKLEEENLEMKVHKDTTQHNLLILKEESDTLCKTVIALRPAAVESSLYTQLEQSTKEISKIIRSTVGNGNIEKVETVDRPPSKGVKEQEVKVRRLSQELETLQEELGRLREENARLLETLEVKERKVAELGILLKEMEQSADSGTKVTSAADQTDYKGQIRKLEVDLKRKSDLLSEVKVLLRQSAEKEREQEKERETLRNQLRSVLDVDPKTPGEQLAKELRQTRLTLDRVSNENKELTHQLSLLKG